MRTLALTTVLAALSGTAQADNADNTWQDIYSKDGLSVMWRSVDGTKMKEIRGVGILPYPAERLLAALTDVPHYPLFMPPVTESRRIWTRGGESVFYLIANPPVIAKRDYCVHIKVSRLPGGELESAWHLTSDGCPDDQPGLVRFRQSAGRWRLTPQSDGTTLVDYRGVTDPGGALPAWMVNRATASALSKMFFSLQKAVGEPKYARCVGEAFGCD